MELMEKIVSLCKFGIDNFVAIRYHYHITASAMSQDPLRLFFDEICSFY